MRKHFGEAVKRGIGVFCSLTICFSYRLPAYSWNGGDNCIWKTEENSKSYWYEQGVRQGTYSDPKGVLGDDGKVRGREIYDSASDGWYWLDSLYNGAKAVNKEVWMPYIYQNEANWDEDQINSAAAGCGEMREQVAEAIRNHGNRASGKWGKWVRYDENGAMIKGWYKVQGDDCKYYPSQIGNVYYYDDITGLMAKGSICIDGIQYHFNETTGVLDSGNEPNIFGGYSNNDGNTDYSGGGNDSSKNRDDQSGNNSKNDYNNRDNRYSGGDSGNNSDGSNGRNISNDGGENNNTGGENNNTGNNGGSGGSNNEGGDQSISGCSVGDIVTFGSYEQDNNDSNGSEAIEWKVLAVNNSQALLVSRYVLDCQPYNSQLVSEIYWETCSVRSWLNQMFYNTAFNSTQQSKIVSSTLTNSGTTSGVMFGGASGGNNTVDKVFLLSLDEIRTYYTANRWIAAEKSGYYQNLMTGATSYAISQGVSTGTISQSSYNSKYSHYGYGTECMSLSSAEWWLRSPGTSQYNAAFTGKDGLAGETNCEFINYYKGIRPAIWVNLN